MRVFNVVPLSGRSMSCVAFASTVYLIAEASFICLVECICIPNVVGISKLGQDLAFTWKYRWTDALI